MTQQTDGRSTRDTAVPPAPPGGHAADSADLTDAPTGELVRRLSTQLSELVRGELELARTELASKGRRAGAGAGLAGAGGFVALFGTGALVAAAIAGLALAVPVWLAALAVGALLLLIAGLLAAVGRNKIRSADPPVPEQAVQGVHRDVETVKGAVHR
jgi:peptidoglycan/LPS O-acetylase OafA/YrhL